MGQVTGGEHKDQKRSNPWFAYGIIVALVFYLVSAWPVTFLISGIVSRSCHLGVPFNDKIYKTIGMLYAPHFWVMWKNRYYYNYITSAISIGSGDGMMTWEEYQEHRMRMEQGNPNG